jgi:4-amino-4-deoxy-L-arabinose transferase-like glycosyltransferase
MLMLVLPWPTFLIDALARVRRWNWRGDDVVSIVRVFSLAWLLLPILFFSFSGSKLPGYILPALPAAALLMAEPVATPSKWALRGTGLIGLVLGAGGIVYAARTGYVALDCALWVGLLMVIAALATFFVRPETAVQYPYAAIFFTVVVLLTCAAGPVAHRESVRDLLKQAETRGYGNVPVLAQRSDDRSAQFYAHDRVIYNNEGEVVTFDEVTVDQARALGGKLLVILPRDDANEYRDAPGIEVIGDNGRTAVLGWTVR